MTKTSTPLPADFIVPLYINGLQGRMLRMPAPKGKKREILFVYGHHSSLERWWGLIQDLNQYGAVTVPDLPGFGGMESLYKIGRKPDIDTLADYLATFIKLRYKRKKVTIAGLSFGFVVATRMLQRYPDLVKKVDLLVSVVGFSHKDDFTFSKTRWNFYRFVARTTSYRIPAWMFRTIALNPVVLRLAYHRTNNAKHKFKDMDKQQTKNMMDFEIHLWHCNDMRTHAYTSDQFLNLDNCQQRVDLPLWHISVDADNYFDKHRVEQHLKVIYKDVHVVHADLNNHAPSVLATAEEVAPLIPKQIRRMLARQPK